MLLAFIMHLHVGTFVIYYMVFLGKYVLMVFLEKLVFMVVSSWVYTRNFNFLSYDQT